MRIAQSLPALVAAAISSREPSDWDSVLVALNICGLQTTLPGKRFRFSLSTPFAPLTDFFFDSFPNAMSPFCLNGERITVEGIEVATVSQIERDTVVLGYRRKEGKVLTVNPKTRSTCTGCKFCYTTLESPQDRDPAVADDYLHLFGTLLADWGLKSLKHCEAICSSTGCLLDEPSAIEHVAKLYEAAALFGFDGRIQFLSSELRSKAGFEEVSRRVPKFQYIVTLECIERRSHLLKPSKSSLAFDALPAIMSYSIEAGHDVNYTYIAGLDSLQAAQHVARILAPFVTMFPIIQVFQPHNTLMTELVHEDARGLDYFTVLRDCYENVYWASALRPRSWENYRPLWYYSFGSEMKHEIRI